MGSKKTFFNEQWLDPCLNPQFSGWLCKAPDKYHAFCKVCKKTFELANMGRQAVLSHAKGKGHSKLIKIKTAQPSLKNFLCVNTNEQHDNTNEDSGSQPGSSKIVSLNPPHVSSVESFCSRDEVARAEVIWALKVVDSKMSLNSCEHLGKTFQLMFPDSAVASKFQMGKTKCSYITNHGLAPYFDNLLKKKLKECNNFVICFDESLNKIVQKGQMDLFVKFFDINTNKVCTQYFNSVFLGRATAQALLDGFNIGIQPLPRKNILQVSMDGPNVNLSFLKKLDEVMREDCPDGKMLMNIGVCGLHVVNGAIKTGLQVVKWDLNNFLRDAYYIFNDSPARRAEFISLTGRKLFPLKHCTIRWLENVPSLERALLVFDDVKKFVENKKSIQTGPFKNVLCQTKDKFMKCKLAFFKTLSMECEVFLRKYQTSSPLAPFLFSDLQILVRNLMERFVKSNKLPATASKLHIFDLRDIDNLRELKYVDIGFQAKKLLKEVASSEDEFLNFKGDCQKILIAMTEKILERSPLKYIAVQGLSSLDPSVIYEHPQQGKMRFRMILEALYTHNRITESIAEKAKFQYALFSDEAHGNEQKKFQEFLEEKANQMRLDDFYSSLLSGSQKYSELWKVVQLCLIFSHGNATVESGFSVNKGLLVENLHEHSLVAQRKVYDAIRYFGSIQKVPITYEMLSYVRSARKHYEDYLENSRKSEKNEVRKHVEKRKLKGEIKELEEQRKILKLKAQQEEGLILRKIETLEKQV